jgi:ribosome biogenesis protein MAK21
MTFKAKKSREAREPATGERGEDFQSYLKRQAEESAKAAKESKLMAPVGVAWYTIIREDKNSTPSTGTAAAVSVQVVEKLRKEGASVMEGEVAQFKREQNLSKADADWFKTVLKSGTVGDRCSALTLAVQASPLHSLEHLKALGEMAKSKSRHEALLALNAMRDLFTSSEGKILPPHRKLRYVHQQHGIDKLENAELRRKCALLWHWEESLKAAYLEMIRVLEIIAQDPIGHSRQRACRILFELLRANPHEQDVNIMSLLANKLGDSERILASRIPYYFTELVNSHPKVLTAGAIEQMRTIIDRSGVTDRTRYYALCFLIQIRLTRGTPTITASLLQIYLGLFTKYILNNLEAVKGSNKKDAKRRLQKRIRHKQKKRGEAVEAVEVPEEHARLAKALLTGINRAFPFASGAGSELKTLLLGFAEPLLKMCTPSVAFPTTVQALNLLLTLAPFEETLKGQVLKAFQTVLDEQDRLRQASASHGLFIRAFTRACGLLMEVNDRKSLQNLLKSLLRFCLAIISPAFVVASLGVLGSVLQRFPAMKSMINTAPESIEAARTEGFYELIALSRHYQPRVRRYALSILETCRLPPESASDRQVLAEPFEKLSFLMLLDVWNRMRRTQQKSASASKSDDESDTDEPKHDFKKSDNAEVAASLYEMDEYRFISKFVAEKDEILAKEQATREKILAKRKAQENDDEIEGLVDDEEEEEEEIDDAELEAEADAIMQQAIKKHASSAFGNEEDDDDFAYEDDDDQSGDDDEEIEDMDMMEDIEDDDEQEDSDNEDYDALFVDSDAENIELLSGEDEHDSEKEPIAKKSKKSCEKSEEQDNKKQKKKKKNVFAAASDYEDALQD